MFNRFEFKIDNPNERITLEISRYDYEIIKRSLEESYSSELHKTPWEVETKQEAAVVLGIHVEPNLKE